MHVIAALRGRTFPEWNVGYLGGGRGSDPGDQSLDRKEELDGYA
jgi:hypothetical protein